MIHNRITATDPPFLRKHYRHNVFLLKDYMSDNAGF